MGLGWGGVGWGGVGGVGWGRVIKCLEWGLARITLVKMGATIAWNMPPAPTLPKEWMRGSALVGWWFNAWAVGSWGRR